MNRIVFSLAAVVFVIVGIGLFFLTKGVDSPLKAKPSVLSSATPTPAPSVDERFMDWKYFRNGYGVKVPPNWKNTSDTGKTATFEPGQAVGGFELITFTILPEERRKEEERFTTQQEFDDWYKLKGDVQGDIQKLDNITMDGQRAIMLIDTLGEGDEWSVIAWTRKDNVNYYINVKGSVDYSIADAEAIDFMVSSFRFKAPPSVPGEDKG